MSVKIFDKAQNKWVIFPGSIGAPGRSAYELAVQQGYKGTLDEWLKSIKGADGRDAYTIAVEGGYKGTEEEYNNALTIAPVAVDKINNADITPTKDSTNLVLSGGVKDAIDSLNSDFNADLATINSSITNLSDEIDNIVNVEIGDQLKSSIIDNLTSSDTEKALSARQGKVLKELIDNLANLQIAVVDTLPATGESNIIYLIKKVGTGTDIHDEYVYVEGNWEKIGTTDVDLSNYYTKTQVDSIKDTLDNKISNNTLSIANITTNGSITPESLKIQKNGVDLLDAWNGSKEGVANIVVPTSLSELNATKDDIVEILGYIPADSAQAGMGDVTGPVTAVDGNLVAFDKDGKHIKDSQYNVGSFAVKNHTHTVSQITDFPEIPDPITVDDTLSTTSTNPVQNKVVATALNNWIEIGKDITSSEIVSALGFTPISSNEIPVALPNPYALSITANGTNNSYTGSSVVNINLDSIFSKKLKTVTTPGQPGIFVGTGASGATYEVDTLFVSADEPDAIIVIPSSTSISFDNTIYTEMQDLGTLTGGTYKCYCITYINSSIVLVNGAIYGNS